MSLVDESVRSNVPAAIRHPLIDCRLDLLDRLLAGLLPRESRLELVRGAEQEILTKLAESDLSSPTDQQVLAVLRNCEPPEAILAAVMAESAGSTLGNHSRESSAAICLMATRRPLLKTAKLSGAFGAASLVLLLAVPWVYISVMVSASFLGETFVYVMYGTYLAMLALAGLAATGTGLTALVQLRRRGGTHTGYGLATAGILVGCVPLLITGLASVLIVSQLLGTGLIAGASGPSPMSISEDTTEQWWTTKIVDPEVPMAEPEASDWTTTDGDSRPQQLQADTPRVETAAAGDQVPPSLQRRTRQLIYTSENFSEILDQWEEIWSLDNPESAKTTPASPAYGPEHGLEAEDSK
ncbi:MAG: hypothetical protein NT069_10755 [Planctomycetota bacterium]|nr:hypothetical protein [Planctomycetota bacterium]